MNDAVTAWPTDPDRWIRVGTQRAIPARFWARTTFHGFTVSVLAGVGQRGPGALKVIIDQPREEDGDPVTMNVLRTVTVDRIIRDALNKLSQQVIDAEAETGIPGAFRVKEGGQVYVQEAPGAGRGRRTTDQRLERVAEIYLNALAKGRPPVNAVAAELPASRSTAGRLVGQARKAGLLTPTTRGRFSSLGEFRRFVAQVQRAGGEVVLPAAAGEREPEPELPPRTVNLQTGEVHINPTTRGKRMTNHAIRHGRPEVSRNDAHSHDKYRWPDGLELFIYDDGRVKIGGWDKIVEVVDVSNFRKGASQASAHVIARFRPTPEETG